MYLKTIEIQGFKSFANRIVFRFHDGITGIVGPNGSGKSNVADAVRWVLGEQSAKSLRGGSMQDVIFAGTQQRKPLGYASVAITLDNGDHSLPVSYDEVTVTRRLYRSGESEYLLNGTSCRLRDINELFYDTGVGKEGYSIIGQGQIEKILSGKPDERRELFDEAAGIVKFKRRKMTAQKKLEDEQQNLLRVNDILSELTRQLGPLERQSEKARIYLKKRDELKAYDVNLFLTEIEELRSAIERGREAADTAQAELEDVKRQSEEIRGAHEALQEQIEALDSSRSVLQNNISDGKLEQSQLEGRIQVLQEQIRSGEENDKARQRRLETIREQSEEKENDLDSLAHAREELQSSETELRSVARLQENQLRMLTNRLDQTSGRIEDNQQAVIALLQERTQLEAERQRCETLLDQIRIRRARLEGQVLKLKSEEKDQNEAAASLEADLEKVTQSIDTLTGRSSEINEQILVLQDQLTGLNAQMEQDQTAYHRESSRLESLKNIAERYDGYGGGIRRVMEQKSREKGLLGVVADLIRTDQKYETAIETALGGNIQNIVTQDEGTAKRMIGFLKQGRYGRATFLPLTAMKTAKEFGQTDALKEPGALGVANTLVRTEQKYGMLVRYLLGRTLVVDNLDHAVAIARKYGYSLRIVTLEGELLSPGGSMTGGAFQNSSNLLGRRREIEDLGKKVAGMSRALDKLRGQIDRARDERSALREELVQVSQSLQQEYLNQNTLQVSLRELTGKQEVTAGDYAQILQESSTQEKESKELEDALKNAREKLEESAAAEEKLNSAGQALQKELERLQKKRDTDQTALQETQLEIASCEQKEKYLGNEMQRVQQEETALREEEQTIRRDMKEYRENESGRENEILTMRARIDEIIKKVGESEEKLADVTAQKEQLGSRQKTFFDQRDVLVERQSLLEREYVRINAQMERQEEKKEARISYMWEEYELTFSAAAALRRDDLGSRSEWRRRMNQLKTEIKELGNVNVNAIEQYKEVSERHEFLSTQHEDLIKAQKALEKIIADLDAGMRARFKEQFARICEEFDKAFQELFGGGQGTLELVEDEDILEAGIRIIAQPPGKKLQNMMQLSGGEKSLTAIALLFAIQNLKPSPFCLLDEIEAALDENNVQRYAQYLHKLTKNTQFIIITHRRGTMAAADRLYGITMQEKGVSTLVSVDLIENELDR